MFKDVKGYEGLYSVNEFGEVWSHEKISSVGKNGGKVIRGNRLLKSVDLGKTKHQRVLLTKNGNRKQHLVHRLVSIAFIENPNNYSFVNHKDGNPKNNNVLNLEWCTAKQNAKHAYDNGLHKPPQQKGIKNSQSKLTENQVKQIKEQHKMIKNCSAIAREFKLNPKTVNSIVNGKSWSHI